MRDIYPASSRLYPSREELKILSGAYGGLALVKRTLDMSEVPPTITG